MALDPRLLKSFVVLAEELHFGRAADRMNLAQPALSQQINRLEKQVGSRLYTRNSRMVELTDAGRAMLEPARAALRAADQAERAAREASRISRHPLRVGVSLYIHEAVPAVAAYASEHQDVQLWMSRMHETQGHEMLAANLLDAFVGVFAPTKDLTIARARSIDVPLFAVLSPRHPIARRSAITLSDYRRSPIAMFARDAAPGHFDYIIDVLSEGEGRHAVSIREFRASGTGDNAEQIAEITAGHAVGFGTPATLASKASHLRVLPFDPGLSVPTYISWDAERSAAVDAFADHMSELA
jgi:DNA-binding transcriptional LysR family regulator